MEEKIVAEVDVIDECELRELGLDAAANDLLAKKELKRKLTIAYERFRFVTPGVIRRFQEEVQKRTHKDHKSYYQYDQLVFIPIAQYSKVPPKEVLTAIREAKSLNCFDSFEIAKIEAVQVRKDPIVFGCIKGCDDKFYIAQWDNDVKIEDILRHNEG